LNIAIKLGDGDLLKEVKVKVEVEVEVKVKVKVEDQWRFLKA